jgi:hypothetical protein
MEVLTCSSTLVDIASGRERALRVDVQEGVDRTVNASNAVEMGLSGLDRADLFAGQAIRELSGALAAGRDLPTPPVGAPGPFALADPDRVRNLLSSAGYSGVELEALHARIWFGSDPDDAHPFVLGLMGWMLEGLDPSGRERALDALRATVNAHSTSDGVTFASGAWLIRARRG